LNHEATKGTKKEKKATSATELRPWSLQETEAMPRISEFFGIVISMFYKDHMPPHIHAAYGGNEAIVGIDPIRVLDGWLPRRVQSLVFE
jgi:hypothetical protein